MTGENENKEKEEVKKMERFLKREHVEHVCHWVVGEFYMRGLIGGTSDDRLMANMEYVMVETFTILQEHADWDKDQIIKHVYEEP